MFVHPRLGLKGRSIALCVLLLLGTVGALGTALIWQNYRDSLRRMTEHAIIHAQSVSHSAEPAVLLNDRSALDHVVQAAGQDRTIEHALILDTNGQQLAFLQRQPNFVSELEVDPLLPMGEPPTRSSTHVRRTTNQMLVVVPIWHVSDPIDLGVISEENVKPETGDAPLGYVCLTYSLGHIQSEFNQRMLSSMLVAMLVICAGIGVTLVSMRQLLRPLQNLVETTAAIAEGDRTKRAREHAVGEIGALARAFNHMAGRLQESYASIEQKVVERTVELEARKRELEREITQRKRVQEQLREQATLLTTKNAELERQQLQLQTHEQELIATNKALEEAKVAAEAASRVKSDFLANMSHEIRTPLTAILGFADNLQDPNLSASEKLEAIATIRQNGSHLVQIVNDILDISKIEAGKLRTEQLACSVVQVIADIKSLMGARALAKGLAFDIEYSGPIPETIHTDPTRLRQILVNLVGNAIKFTSAGSVRLVTGLKGSGFGVQGSGSSDRLPKSPISNPQSSICNPQSPFLQFDIVDTGIGMRPEQVELIFKPFVQADETMTRNFGGTGLGLAISQRLAKILGGDIKVESTLDKGSTFSVTIATGPLEGVPMLKHPSATTTVHPDQPTSAKLTVLKLDCRILLAEDGPDNQRLISFLLEKAGAHVEVAENGKIAAEKALEARQADNPFDVILMDMQMPVMDGYCATALLRQEGYTYPIIALTAHAMAQDRDKCLNAGCDDYATKPIDRQALIELIQRYVTAGVSAAGPT